MSLQEIIYIITAVLLIAVLVVATIMARAGSTYSWNVGDNEIQERMRWRIFKSLIALVIIGISAAIINIVSVQL